MTSQSIEIGEIRVHLVEPATKELFARLQRLADSCVAVLVHGETGVGKEVAARALHHFSRRRRMPLVAVNCAAIPEDLAEAELFGHERGAFTGATESRPGLLESANHGTLFLDEVGELPLNTQSRLLRALDSGLVRRVGSMVERRIDARIVSATNRDLHAEVRAKRFREDLYYRLAATTVRVAPLRERVGDISLIAAEFLAVECARNGRLPLGISPETMRALVNHPWPGNVRELKNAMQVAAATAGADAGAIVPDDLPPAIHPRFSTTAIATIAVDQAAPPVFRPIAEEVGEFVRRRMMQALDACGGNQTRAAHILQMPRRTFVLRMKKYAIEPMPPDAMSDAH
jgi:two-component system response regulator AtoC